jgi:hypothetical protein
VLKETCQKDIELSLKGPTLTKLDELNIKIYNEIARDGDSCI